MGDGTTDAFFKQRGVQNPQRSAKTTAIVQPLAYSVKQQNGVAVKTVRNTAIKVNGALLKLNLLSTSLNNFINLLDNELQQDPDATFPENKRVIGVTKDSIVFLDTRLLSISRSNMVKYIGGRTADIIMLGKDDEDKLLILSFLDISLVPRASQGAKNVPPRRSARIGQLSFLERSVRRRNKMSTVNNSNVIELSNRAFGVWSAWRIDYAALNRLFKEETRTSVDANGLLEIMNKVAVCVNASEIVPQVIMNLECGWPNRDRYVNTMPRDDGSMSYRGVSQAAIPFWTDVRDQLKGKGITIPTRPENSTLAMQIASPFIYADKYRRTQIGSNRLSDWPLTPAVIYSFHQQSLGGLKASFNPGKAIGSQSGASLQVVKVAFQQRGQTGMRVTL